MGDFNTEFDRGLVLIAAAYIDDLLGKTIAAFLVEDAETEELACRQVTKARLEKNIVQFLQEGDAQPCGGFG